VDRSEPPLVRVVSRGGEVLVDEPTYALLSRRAFRPVARMLAEFSAETPEAERPETWRRLRETLDTLLAQGLLQLEPGRLPVSAMVAHR